MDDILTMTPQGLFCPAGRFHIDPWGAAERAVLTHGHSDHARSGSSAYLSTDIAAPVIRHRLGPIRIETLPYGQPLQIGGAQVSFHPAGHVPGSAQVRVAVGGRVAVVSGDYKTTPDGLSTPWDPVPCHLFISECTFGLPLFRWADEARLAAELNAWWAANAAEGRFSVIAAYSFGKAQRLMTMAAGVAPILTHGAVEEVTAVLRAQGLPLPPTIRVTPGLDLKPLKGALVIAPPSALATPWARRFGEAATATASGWMAVRGIRRRRGTRRGFVISDHADWPGLNAAIAATGAERVLMTHGYTDSFARWLTDQGRDAAVLETAFGAEEPE
jgi:putative mRNA 3-end processing factor